MIVEGESKCAGVTSPTSHTRARTFFQHQGKQKSVDNPAQSEKTNGNAIDQDNDALLRDMLKILHDLSEQLKKKVKQMRDIMKWKPSHLPTLRCR